MQDSGGGGGGWNDGVIVPPAPRRTLVAAAPAGAAARPAVVVSSAVTASHRAGRRQISWPPAGLGWKRVPVRPPIPGPISEQEAYRGIERIAVG